MSAKFSASRKRAFLTYLTQSGNQSLSAERAKVSRSWVSLHRSTDAGFDAACREAIAEARVALEALASAPPHPPAADAAGPSLSREGRGAKWKYFEGHELVVRGTGGSALRDAASTGSAAPQDERKPGRRVQIGRARVKQWTPRVERRFLAALAGTCSVKAACAEAGMWPPSAYAHRQRWAAFADAWDAAVETGYARLEAALLDAACNPFSDPNVEPDLTIRGMTAQDALQLLHMHKHAVRGIGKRPGLPERQPSWAEVGDYFTRALRRLGHRVGGG